MPFTGGGSPSPERYGGAKGGAPLLRRVYESLSSQRGNSYDQSWPINTLVATENMAMARAITFDGYGANERLANNFLPAKMTAIGLLPRWEKILNVPPLPGDSEPTRRMRVAAALAQVGQPNGIQAFLDVCNTFLGNIFLGVTHFDPSNALSWWPGNSGTSAQITALTGGNIVTIAGLANVPSAAYGNQIALGNTSNASNSGTITITSRVSSSSVQALNPSGVSPDYGIGGSISAGTITWAINNPFSPWSSTIDMIDIQVDPTVAGYHNSDGSPNGLFWATLNQCAAVLDKMVPAWVTWNFWRTSPTYPQIGILGMGFILDEANLGLEVFQ